MSRTIAALLLLTILGVNATVFFKETFDDTWQSRWVHSGWKKNEGQAGEWKLTAGDWYGDKEEDRGIQTSQDARFYAISAKLPKTVNNKDKTLVFQFQVRFPQRIDCGGGYIKLLPEGLNQNAFSGDSEYSIMFGPDICGTSTRKTHLIFNYKGKNLLVKREIRTETDQLSHVYTLILHSDNTYEVRIDGKQAQSGNLQDDWDFLPPKMIKDPAAKKPADWVDEAMIDDVTDVKPADWDNTPKQIPDPDAEKPEDWDDEADGKWEPPMIDNPDYKGEWKPKKIANPAYKGPWVHPEIANPDYYEDKNLYLYEKLSYVGIELWQVKAGTIFDNIIVTDSVEEAEAFLEKTYTAGKDKEKAMFDEFEKKKRDEEEAQRKKIEEERKKQDEEKDDDDDDDDDDEEDNGKDEL